MRLLLYYMVHTFLNAIKKLFKSWVAVIIVIAIGFGLLVGVTVTIASSFIQQVADQSGATTGEWAEDDEDEDEGEENKPPLTEEQKQVLYKNVALVVAAITIVILVINIYPGSRSGEDLFMMADINFLLTAPIRPQTILLYKTILKMGLMLLSTLYIMGQIPNLVINLQIPAIYAFYLIGIWLLMAVSCKLASILAYTLTAGREWAKNLIRRGLLVIALVLGVLVFLVMQRQGVNILEAARIVFLSKIAMGVPIVGWITGLTDAVLSGQMTTALIYLALNLAGFVAMILIIWNTKVDFYEDSITKATNLSERVAASKSGMKNNRKRKKEAKTNEIGRGQGASCFMANQFYNRQRFAYFGLITNTGILYLAIGILGSLFFAKMLHVENIAALGAVFLLVCYIRNYGNPIARETQMNFMYMIPESAFSKLGYSITASSLIAGIDVLPAIIAGGIILKSDVPSCVVWWLLIVSFDFMLSNTGLLADLLLPTYITEVVKSMFALFFKMMGIVPLIIVMIISLALQIPTFITIGMLVAVALNLGFGLILLAVSSKLLTIGRS